MTHSQARKHFESESFDRWRKGEENRVALLKGVCDRLDNAIKALNNMGKGRRR